MKKPLDPARLSQDSSTASPLAAALRAARSAPDPKALSRMSLSLGVAAPIAPPPVPPASGLAVATGSALPKLGLVALVGAVGTGAALSLAPMAKLEAPAPVHSVPVTSTAVTAQATAVESEAVAPVHEAPRAPAPNPVTRPRRADPERAEPTRAEPVPSAAPETAPPSVAVPSAPPDAASRLREEALLVRSAERLLASEPSRALALTEERRRRFPGGALDQEAEVVAIDALLRLGRRDAALSRARSFEARHPGSLHARRIRSLVGTDL